MNDPLPEDPTVVNFIIKPMMRMGMIMIMMTMMMTITMTMTMMTMMTMVRRLRGGVAAKKVSLE